MSEPRPYCLSIAGFDPSGGAGIIADAKVFEHLGVQGLFVQTANTIQTEDEFQDINWISKDIILKQLEVILNRYQPRYIKIGLIQSAEMLEAVLRLITDKSDAKTIIWDPILKATAGGDFNENRFQNISADLWEKVIITPNSEEVLHFSKDQLHSFKGVYIKGGDKEDKKGVDLFRLGSKAFTLNPKKISASTFHGTGCHFSSAFLGHIAKGYPLLKSALRSKRLMEKWLSHPQGKLARIKN